MSRTARSTARRSPSVGRAAACRCAATTSTPIASCRRGFCVAVSFEGLEQHLFEDDRKANRGSIRSTTPATAGATMLVVNANFGCGSSREHAPQGLVALRHPRDHRRVVLGDLPGKLRDARPALLHRRSRSIEKLQALDRDRRRRSMIDANVEDGSDHRGRAGDSPRRFRRRCATRSSAASGIPTAMLLADFGEVREVAHRLPYVAGF